MRNNVNHICNTNKLWIGITIYMLSFLFVTIVLAQSGGTVPAHDLSLRLKFNGATLDIVLNDYSEKTDRTLLQAPNLPKSKITLRSQTELTIDEYLQAIETVLGMHGIALLRIGEKFLKVVPIRQVLQEGSEIRESMTMGLLDERGKLISQMIQLKYIDVDEAVKAVNPIRHASYGKIDPFKRTNSILVTDTTDNINRIVQIIKYIDQPIEAREAPNVIQIHHAKASDIKRKLEEIIADSQKQAKKSTVPRQRSSGQPGVSRRSVPGVIRSRKPVVAKGSENSIDIIEQAERGIIRGKVKIVADERTNILIIITRPENMKFFERVIKVLDVETDPDVVVKVIHLEYADADTVANTLNTLIGKIDKGKGGKVVSGAGTGGSNKSIALNKYVEKLQKEKSNEKGKSKVGELSAANIKILPDKRTNALLVMASKSDFVAIEEIVKSMDIMLSQVMIEVVIFKITLTDSFERGVDWVQRALIAYGEKGGGRTPIMAFAGTGGGDTVRSGLKDKIAAKTGKSLSSTSGNLTYFFTFFDINLDAVIKFIASDSRTQIVSSPLIMTTDNKEASINVTKEKYFFKGLKFISTSGSGAGEWVDDVTMKKVGAKLTVLPRINRKKHVVLEISQSFEEEGLGQPIRGAGGLSVWPTIDASELTASVAVKSGETIVLGGLVSKSKIKNKNKIPLLGDIPILGGLFQWAKDVDTRSEIIVFITPYVLDTPEDIERESVRRKDATKVGEIWPKNWSASKLADRNEDDDTIIDQKEKKTEIKTDAFQKKVDSAVEQTFTKNDKEQVEEKNSKIPKSKEELDPMSNLDQEMVEFIRKQENRWHRTLKKIDKRINKELLKNK